MLIPDISGFSHFVNNTEIIHSVHIIAEMLETLIDHNILGLKVAEVEGDAVFFYRIGEAPTVKEINAQIEEMYLAFHQLVKVHERDRICSCGACSTVNNLKVKFVSHYGNVVERKIHDHFQLMGADVVKLHKLLKNNVDHPEYYLFTQESLLDLKKESLGFWGNIQNKTIYYDGIGELNYHYVALDKSIFTIPELEAPRQIELIEYPIKSNVIINCSIDKTFDLLKDLDRRSEWVKKLKQINYKLNQVQRAGSTHDCVLPLNTVSIETVSSEESIEQKIFVEYTDSSTFFPAFFQRFILSKVDEGSCSIESEIHYKGNRLKGALLKFAIRNAIDSNLYSFKNYCESFEE